MSRAGRFAKTRKGEDPAAAFEKVAGAKITFTCSPDMEEFLEQNAPLITYPQNRRLKLYKNDVELKIICDIPLKLSGADPYNP